MTAALPSVLLLDRALPLDQAAAAARGAVRLSLSRAAEARLAEGHRRLQGVIAARRHVYGLTTGFGPLADRLVDPADGVALQQNLVHHLASGVGPPLDWDEARAMVLARLMSIAQGVSGASPAVAGVLVALLNSPFAPEIPSRGTVGASGDLTPLAHMVLCLQGRGRFLTRDGSPVEAAGVVGAALPQLDLTGRDGLALVNGTSAMTGCALLTAADAASALGMAVALSAALAEVLHGRVEAWHPAFAVHRPHPGQARVAAALLARVAGSDRVERRPIAATVLDEAATRDAPSARRIGQDAYTLRCVPQVLGAVADTLDWHDRVVATELASVTDNPLFPVPSDDDADLPPALHGGNFMGQHVGLASDALSNAVIVMAGLAERQVARLTDERLNDGLPAFLHRGAAGLNSGFMGAQVTATALLAELRAGAGAASIQSISTNGANQDVVSMGTIAARQLRRRLELTRQIQAILALAVAQAMEMRAEAGGPRTQVSGTASAHGREGLLGDRAASETSGAGVPTGVGVPTGARSAEADAEGGPAVVPATQQSGLPGFSADACALHALVRRVSPRLETDRPLGPEITALAQLLRGDPGSLRWPDQAA